MKDAGHLVSDNSLIWPRPLISNLNLNQGLVSLGGKLSKRSTG